MGGYGHTALTGASFSAAGHYMSTVAGRMGDVLTGNQTFAYRDGVMLASRNDMMSDAGQTLFMVDSTPKLGIWAKTYGSIGERRGNEASSKYDYDTGGILFGFDGKVSNSLLLGIAAGYSGTEVDMDGLEETADVKSYQGSLYGTWLCDPWYVKAIAAFAYNRYSSARGISFGEIDRTAHATYSGTAISAYAEAGYLLKINSIVIVPMASFQATRLTREDFRETNAGALNLQADREQASSLLGTLGIRLKKDFRVKTSLLTPELRAGWLHEFSGDGYVLTASFAGSPSAIFTVKEDKPVRDRGNAGFGLTWATGSNIDVYLFYDATFTGDRTEHSAYGGIRYQW
jgi:outer membrane autotransporter protein